MSRSSLSWQITPSRLGQLLGDPDREKAGRAIAVMLEMRKIVIRDLEAAFEGTG